MAKAARRLATQVGGSGICSGLLSGGLLSLIVLSGSPKAVAGQPPSRIRASCPLVVPAQDAELQPLRIHPSQVPRKNARGCLSPADAIYAADGCPERLCGKNAGVIQLPPLP